jgi:hypothetical protein
MVRLTALATKLYGRMIDIRLQGHLITLPLSTFFPASQPWRSDFSNKFYARTTETCLQGRLPTAQHLPLRLSDGAQYKSHGMFLYSQ